MTQGFIDNGVGRTASVPPRGARDTHFTTSPAVDAKVDSGSLPLRKSLFHNSGDMRIAQKTLEDTLRGSFDGRGATPNEIGLYKLDDAAKIIQHESMDMQYIDRNHLVEIYLRDTTGSFVLEGDLIGHVRYTQITPPAVLYFGTTEEISRSAIRHGIMSSSRIMATLFDNIEDAFNIAYRYANRKGDAPVVIQVDAKAAYDGNTDFSYSGVKGEYLVERVGYRYLTSVHHDDGVVVDLKS